MVGYIYNGMKRYVAKVCVVVFNSVESAHVHDHIHAPLQLYIYTQIDQLWLPAMLISATTRLCALCWEVHVFGTAVNTEPQP